MDYCGNCGEPLEGRFCRMCGTPGGVYPDAAAMAALPGYAGGYGTAQGGLPGSEGTQMLAAPAATGYGYPPAAGYGADPSAGYGADPAATGYAQQAAGYAQQSPGYGPDPLEPVAATPAEFDGLFRTADGSPGAHGQTQLLPPVEADYRTPPPGAVQQPPGGGRDGGYDDEDEERSNRPMILATVGAVVVAAGVILGLLYLGNQGNSGSPTASSTSSHAVSSATGAQAGGAISIPTDGATLGPTATASSPASNTAGSFHGDSLPLGPGSSGAWVRWVQERLHQLGYFHGDVNGDFDQATALAVQQFQAAAGVTGDPASTVGLHTVVALEAAGQTPNLHVGSKNSDVSRLNAALTYATGTHLSGSRYTMATAAAVLAYQQAVGLQPTGQVDGATWAKLQDGTLATG